MIGTAPDGFTLSSFLKGIYTFQSWEIFPGHKTKGPKDVTLMLDRLGITDLRGKRVLDIAPWNGFFTFECARRGATEVISYGPDDPDMTGYNKVRDVIGATNCRYIRGSVYNLNTTDLGTFDVVLFLGLVYHLRHPLLAFDRIYDMCSNTLCVDTAVIDNIVFDKTLSEPIRKQILNTPVMHELPLIYFTKANETGDAFNWFMPNKKAFASLVEASGFRIERKGDDGAGWAWITATKSDRNFVPDLEGFNPTAQKSTGNN